MKHGLNTDQIEVTLSQLTQNTYPCFIRLVFTAWGVGGFMLALLAGKLYDTYQAFAYAYYGAATLLVIAAAVTFLVKSPHVVHEAAE